MSIYRFLRHVFHYLVARPPSNLEPEIALYLAIERDDVTAVIAELQRGSKLNDCCVLAGNRYRTPLELAIERDNAQVLEAIRVVAPLRLARPEI